MYWHTLHLRVAWEAAADEWHRRHVALPAIEINAPIRWAEIKGWALRSDYVRPQHRWADDGGQTPPIHNARPEPRETDCEGIDNP